MSMKNSNDAVRNRTRDLLACSTVLQPTAPLRAHLRLVGRNFFLQVGHDADHFIRLRDTYRSLFTNRVHTIKAVCSKEVNDLKMSVRIPEVADYDDDFFQRLVIRIVTSTVYSLFGNHTLLTLLHVCRVRLNCDGTCAETRFCLLAKRTSPFKAAGASVQSITGSRGVRVSFYYW